jgi:hypothetical protein
MHDFFKKNIALPSTSKPRYKHLCMSNYNTITSNGGGGEKPPMTCGLLVGEKYCRHVEQKYARCKNITVQMVLHQPLLWN